MRTFAEAAIPADRERVARLIGSDGKRLAREIAQAAGRQLADEEADRIDRRSGEVYDTLNTNPRPTSGARSLLVSLERSDLDWAIATSSLADQTKVSVQALDLPEEPLIVDGSHVEHAKPAPDLLLLAAHRVGLQPNDCWYVGDSTWDMIAARVARMTAVGVAYGAVDGPDLLEAGADAVTTLSDLEEELRARGLLQI